MFPIFFLYFLVQEKYFKFLNSIETSSDKDERCKGKFVINGIGQGGLGALCRKQVDAPTVPSAVIRGSN
jgi:hypothetical protein